MNLKTDPFAACVPSPVAGSAQASTPGTIPVTRTRLRVKQSVRQNRFVVIGAGALMVAFLLFLAVSIPRSNSQKVSSASSIPHRKHEPDNFEVGDHSILPIIDPGQQNRMDAESDTVTEQAVEHTATRVPTATRATRPAPVLREGTLASVPPFPEPWQPPPYSRASDLKEDVPKKSELDEMQKSSLAYVRNASAAVTNVPSARGANDKDVPCGLDLPVGTRLRARLESAASTSLHAPVIAVIEYNYERAGEIIVPAGARAIGHIQQADRSGYMTIQFETLMLPNDSSIPIQAVGTDLNLGPPRGKVEGKSGSKNLFLRSLSGIGQAGAMLVGHGSLDQPLSESDMLRERVSNNIGQASDEQISRLTFSEHIVVTIPANTSIYVILEKDTDSETPTAAASNVQGSSNAANVEDLRQLLQLQTELKQRQEGR